MNMRHATQMRRMVAAGLLTAGLLSGCSGTKSNSVTIATTSPPHATGGGSESDSITITTTTVPPPSAAPAKSAARASGAKCSDLTDRAASAAVGKPTTVTLDTSGQPLAGLTLCNVTVAAEIYPIQLAVDTKDAPATYAAEKQAYAGTALGGLGDKAFRSSVGVEALSGGVTISVTGPAGPVLSGNFTVPTAIVRAMISAIK